MVRTVEVAGDAFLSEDALMMLTLVVLEAHQTVVLRRSSWRTSSRRPGAAASASGAKRNLTKREQRMREHLTVEWAF